jgi:hypothetical protein
MPEELSGGVLNLTVAGTRGAIQRAYILVVAAGAVALVMAADLRRGRLFINCGCVSKLDKRWVKTQRVKLRIKEVIRTIEAMEHCEARHIECMKACSLGNRALDETSDRSVRRN